MDPPGAALQGLLAVGEQRAPRERLAAVSGRPRPQIRDRTIAPPPEGDQRVAVLLELVPETDRGLVAALRRQAADFREILKENLTPARFESRKLRGERLPLRDCLLVLLKSPLVLIYNCCRIALTGLGTHKRLLGDRVPSKSSLA
jgi:hypothetical protein